MKEKPKKDQEEVLHLNPTDIRIEFPTKPSDIKKETHSQPPIIEITDKKIEIIPKPSDITKEIPSKISEIKNEIPKKKRKHNKSKSYESFLEIKPENDISTKKRCSISTISAKVVDIKNLLTEKIEIPVKKHKKTENNLRKKKIVYKSKSSEFFRTQKQEIKITEKAGSDRRISAEVDIKNWHPFSDSKNVTKEENEKKKINIIEKIAENFSQINLKQEKAEELINIEEETAFSLSIKSLNSVIPEQREKFLINLCHQIDSEDLKISLPPKENSIALDNSNLEIKASLEKVQAPQQFLETTETVEIEEISKQIECITGFDVVKGTAKALSEIKIKSSELKNSHVLLQKEVDNLKVALQNDIAGKLGISPQDVYIRRIVPGSMEILFSVPENVKGLDLKADDLPSFNQILQQNGISKKYRYKQRKVLPDPEMARKILENYTRPVIINTEKNSRNTFQS